MCICFSAQRSASKSGCLPADLTAALVQGLDHRREAPAGLVQIRVAGPQGFAHGVLAGEAHIGGVSVSPERVRRTGHQPPFLRPAPPAGEHRAQRQRALDHGERRGALTADPSHERTSSCYPCFCLQAVQNY